MAKLTLNDLTNLQNENSVVTKLNNNNTLIETALDNTLSRDGSSPNSMAADLDMDGNAILNLPEATTDTQPIRKGEFDAAIEGLTASGIALPTSGLISYNADTGLAVARTFEATLGSGITITNPDGVDGNPNFDFDSSTVTFTTALDAIKNLTPAADKVAYYTGTSTAALTPLTSFARTLIDDADAATARTTLGAQASDAELTAIAGLTSAADSFPYFTGSGTAALATIPTYGRSLASSASASSARGTLGLVIGTDVQAQDAELAALAGLTSAADTLPYFTGSGTANTTAFTSFGRSLVDDADASTAQTTLGVSTFVKTVLDDADASTVRGTIGAQASDATLTALAGVTTAADKVIYATGIDTFTTTDFTSTARSLVDDTSTSAMRTTLGLAIGTDVEAHDATLTALAGVTTAADKVIYATGIDTFTTADLTSTARSLLDDTSTSAMRTTLGVAIGSNVQAWDADLDQIAGLTKTKGNIQAADGTNWNALGIGTDTWVLTADAASTNGVKWAVAPGAGGGLSNAYTNISDGTNSSSATASDTIRFKAGTGVTTLVDSTAGHNVTYGVNAVLQSLSANTAPSGTLVGTSDTQTLTSKTLTTPIITSISNGGTVTIPSGADTLVARTSTDTLTNKTLTTPVIASISNGGTVTIPSGADTLVARTSTDTLTNKRVTPRRGTTASSATPAINSDSFDVFSITALAANITSMTSSLSGTPTHGQGLLIEITGTAARTIAWGTSFEASTIALPVTTVTTNMISIAFIWNSTTSKWRVVGVA